MVMQDIHFVIHFVFQTVDMEHKMTAISLRLPDDIEIQLKTEAQLEGKTQSEIARLAIMEYLVRRKKERFMAEMIAEMRTAYAEPEIRRKAMEIAEDAVDEGLDALVDAERAAGIDPDEKWWR
jgi:predicted transcriptional regulator